MFKNLFGKALQPAPAAQPAPAYAPTPAPGALALPAWATVRGGDPGAVSVVIEADTAAAYAEWLALLGSPTLDQYWIEVAYQCAKMDLQAAIVGTQYDPRTAGKSAEFRFSRAPQFALAKHPAGKGVNAATKGREAREHYRRVRGRLPF